MPRVGKKHFPYTAAGRKAAKAYARKRGKRRRRKRKMKGY